jgi:hypothetical protein
MAIEKRVIHFVYIDFIQFASFNYWIKMNFGFQNVVMHILKLFTCDYDWQIMPSRFQLIIYYDICYASPFLVKNSSPIVCFHPNGK